ncbi:MAG: acylphosphatase [archaeon]
MKKAVKVIISGSVQGVFFRGFIKEQADRLKIKGHVRNLEDGKVEAWIEGDGKNVDQMIEICKKGPPHGQIRRLDEIDEKFQGFTEFKILNI